MIYPICLYGNSILKSKAGKVKKDEVDVIKLSDEHFPIFLLLQKIATKSSKYD